MRIVLRSGGASRPAAFDRDRGHGYHHRARRGERDREGHRSAFGSSRVGNRQCRCVIIRDCDRDRGNRLVGIVRAGDRVSQGDRPFIVSIVNIVVAGRHRHRLGIGPVYSSEGQLRGADRHGRLRRVGDGHRHVARRLTRQYHLVRADILRRPVGLTIINLRQRQGRRRHRYAAGVVIGDDTSSCASTVGGGYCGVDRYPKSDDDSLINLVNSIALDWNSDRASSRTRGDID